MLINLVDITSIIKGPITPHKNYKFDRKLSYLLQFENTFWKLMIGEHFNFVKLRLFSPRTAMNEVILQTNT